MSVKAKYSLVFQPYEAELNYIKSIKYKLAEQIGWFSSKDALAHISIAEFEANDTELDSVVAYLTDFVLSENRQYLYFDQYASFPTLGTWFIKPTVPSKLYMQEICKSLWKDMPIPLTHLPAELHLTIARKLSQEQLQIAKDLLKQVDFDFLCDQLVLRKFDPQLRQYQPYAAFKFQGLPKVRITSDEQGQINLF